MHSTKSEILDLKKTISMLLADINNKQIAIEVQDIEINSLRQANQRLQTIINQECDE